MEQVAWRTRLIARGLACVALSWTVPASAQVASDAGIASSDPDASAPSIDLLSPLALARAAGVELSDPRSEVERDARRFDRGLRGDLRRDAIRSGRADSYHYALGHAMQAALHLDEGERLLDELASTSLPAVVLREPGRYGGGRPIEPRGTPLPEATPRSIDSDTVDPRDRMDDTNLLNGRVRWRRVVLRVHQDRTGEVIRVDLVRSSGLPSIDAAALAAARGAAVEGPPPSRVLGDLESITSDWAIEIGEVATSFGEVGCTDGPGSGCAMLGRGLLRTRVELLDVSDASLPSEEE